MNTELISQHVLCNEMIFYVLLAINKGTHILTILFSCSCSDTTHGKGIRENRKKVPFLKVYHFSISQHFSDCKGGSRARSERVIYFNANKLPPNR